MFDTNAWFAVGGLPNLGGPNFDEAISAHYTSMNNYDISTLPVCAGLIERFGEPVYDILTSAGLSADDIDAVILAGSSSVMPFVKKHKGLVRFAAVLMIGGALAYGYTRYTAYQQEQE